MKVGKLVKRRQPFPIAKRDWLKLRRSTLDALARMSALFVLMGKGYTITSIERIFW